MASYIDSLTDRYFRELTGRNRVTGRSTSNPLASLNSATFTQPLGPGAFVNRVEGAVGPESTLGKVIDVISRPVYGAGNLLKESVDVLQDAAKGTRDSNYNRALDRGDNPLNVAFNNTIGAGLSGLSGRSKTMPSDALFEQWEPKSAGEGAARFAAGLATDIIFDPITYIPGGAIAGAARKAPGVSRAISALQKSGVAAKEVRQLPEEVTNLIRTSAKAADEGVPSAPAEKIEGLRQIFNRFAPQTSVEDSAKLPSLYALPKTTPATAKVAENFESWLSRVVKEPVGFNNDRLVFSGENAASNVTVGDVVSSAKETQNTDLMGKIRDLFERTVQGADKSTPGPDEVAGVAARRAGGPSRLERLQGEQRQKVLAELKERLSPEDYIYLVRTRSSETFNARRREILARSSSKVEPVFPRSIAQDAEEGTYLASLIGPTTKTPDIRKPLMPTNPSVARAVEKAAERQFRTGYSYRSGVKDTSRSHVPKGVGRGVSDRGFNKYAQYNLFKDLVDRASATIMREAPNLKGAFRGERLKKQIFDELEEAFAVLRSRGIEPILGSGHSGIAMSLLDILQAINVTKPGQRALLKFFFDMKKANIAPTNLADAVEHLLFTMSKNGVRSADDVDSFLRAVLTEKGDPKSFFSELGWTLAKDPRGKWSPRQAGNPRVVKGLTRRETKHVWDNSGPKKYHTVESKQVNVGGQQFSDAINEIRLALLQPATVRELVKMNIRNSSRYNAQFAYEVQRLSDDVVTEFFNTLNKPTTSTGEIIYAYRNVAKAVDSAGKSINATDDAIGAARKIVDSEIRDVLAEDIEVISALERVIKSTTNTEVRVAAQKLHDTLAKDVLDNLPTHVVMDFAEAEGAILDYAIIRALFPILARAPKSLIGRTAASVDHVLAKFIPNVGHATLRPAMTQAGSAVRNLANNWRDVLTQVHKVFPDEVQLRPIMAQLQNNVPINPANFSPAQQQAIEQFTTLTKLLFETNVERGIPGASSIFFRNGIDLDHLNGKLNQMKLPESMRFDLDLAEVTAAKEGISVRDALANQWRQWKIDDPVDFLARMQAVALSTIGDAAIAREATRIAASKGLMSMSRREGFVKITDSSDKSVLLRYLPPGAWWHKDIVNEIRAMDNVLQQSFNLGEGFGKWVNTYLDPALNMWKAGMTIYRPGHHIRNLIGDESLSFLADGVQSVRHKRNTLKVMSMHDNYDGWSALRALYGWGPDSARVSEETLRRGSEVVANVVLRGGKKRALTADEVYKFTKSHGMLPDFLSGEDLLQSADRSSETIRKIQEAMSVAGGRVRRFAGRASEARDDYVRLSHFLQIVEKNTGKFNSVEDLMDFAVRRVRKWHPDGTDLSVFESKYMRRLFPFYSWTRKSVPLVVESLLLEPGRVMVWPKAMYNVAKASGINIESMSNPFPQDQLFPSFLTDEMTGPVADIEGSYYNFNPGLAHADVMNQFGGNPRAGILSMLTPFIKAPAEALSGSRLDTGGRINDTSEYLGSTAPGVAQAQSLSGYDILGTLFGGRGPESTTAVEKGNREQLDLPAFLNYFLGTSVQDMSKPSYINFAEIERRDRAAREGKRW